MSNIHIFNEIFQKWVENNDYFFLTKH